MQRIFCRSRRLPFPQNPRARPALSAIQGPVCLTPGCGARLRGKLLRLVLACLAAAQLAAPAFPQEAAPLKLGVFPYLSTRATLGFYQPLQAYLEKRLQRPVTMETARDQRTFVERTQRGDYDLAITPPHFARLAQQEAGYVPMLKAKADLYGLLVVAKASAIARVSDLRGKVVVTPDPLAVISMLGEKLLEDNGLHPGSDVTVAPLVSHASAVLAVVRGEAAAAVTSVTALAQMPKELKEAVRVIATTRRIPHVFYLANPRLPSEEVSRVTRILLDFVEQTPEGQRFIANLNHQGLVSPGPGELESMDPYVAQLKALLGKH